MSAEVLLSDTFDQWRMKNNEWLSMGDPSGSSNFIKTNATTNSTSNTTGAITTAGGLGIGSSAVVGGNLTVFGDADVDGTLNIDVLDIDGAVQIDGTVTVGVDDTGYDVKFFGATSGQYMLWDQSEDELILLVIQNCHFMMLQVEKILLPTADGHLEINAGTTLDITAATVDINSSTKFNVDGPTQLTGAVTFGVDDTSANVKFFGATSGSYMLWQEDVDDLVLAGASALSIDTTTDSSNTTTGSFHTDGGVGIAKKLYVGTDLDVDGTTNLDAVDIDGAVQIDNTVAVGTNGSGFDVKFFGDTSSAFMLWDASADDLILSGAAALSIETNNSGDTGVLRVEGGASIAKKLYVGTDLDVDGTTNLDIVDIDGATQIDNTVSVSTNGNGQDVKFFGATSGSYWHWDASADKVIQVGSTQLTGALTIGVDGTGHDVKLFGDTASAYMEWDQSADELEIRGPVATAGKLLLSTAEATVVDGNKLGQIDFQSPIDDAGTDAIVVGASIVAEADATFSASVNSTDLVFLTADSGAATEKVTN